MGEWRPTGLGEGCNILRRIYEQVKHATIGGDYTLWMLLQPLVMAKSSWDKLTPEQKKAFTEAADKSDEYFTKDQETATDEMKKIFTKAGADVRALSKPEFDAWLDLARKTAYPDYEKVSPDAKELLKLISEVK